VACFGPASFAADEPRLLPLLDEEDAVDHDVVGTVVREWNDKRQRHEYVVHDHRDDIRYVILPEKGIDRAALVGRSIGLDGRTRLREDLTEGLVYPREIHFLDSDIEPVQFVDDRRAPNSPRLAQTPPLDIDINVGDTTAPPVVGSGVPPTVGPGFGFPGLNIPGLGLPGYGQDCPTCGRGGFLNGGGVWGRVEYLLWDTSGMSVPPLVTTSPPGTIQDDAGVLGVAGTQILFGGNEILDDYRSGGRLRAGVWLGPRFGLEGEYFQLHDETTAFAADNNTASIVAIPFFNLNPRDPMNPALFAPAREDSFLIDFPNVIAGSVSVAAENRFESTGIRALMKLCGHSPGINCPEDRRVDLIFGYRYLRLEDRLALHEELNTLNGTNQTFDITDSFRTKNHFHGIETGAQIQGGWQRVSYEFLAKIALGNVNQKAAINGSTDITVVGAGTTTSAGGIFAQTSNIGSYSRDQFAVVPELGATLGFKLTKRLRATLGYSFIYVSRVLRAGDQIDREINQDFLPPQAVPFTGPQRPAFAFHDTSFWAQGFSAGLDFRW